MYVKRLSATVAVELFLTMYSYRPVMKRKMRNKFPEYLSTTQRLLDRRERNSQSSPSSDRPFALHDVFPTSFLQHRISGLACAAREQRAGGGGSFTFAEGFHSCILILDTLARSRYHTSRALDDGDARQACLGGWGRS